MISLEQAAGKVFAWERPFSKADVRRFGDETPPDGPIVAVRVADLAEKEAALAEVLLDGWLACAPPGLAEQHVELRAGKAPRLRRARQSDAAAGSASTSS